MNMTEIRERAKALGLTHTGRLKKADLIRCIQRAEGNFDCYESAGRHQCRQLDCCWRESCLGSHAS